MLRLRQAWLTQRVSAYVHTAFDNYVSELSFSEPFFEPSLGQTQRVTAVFASYSTWLLQVLDEAGSVVRNATNSGYRMEFDWDGKGDGGTNLPNGIYEYLVTATQATGWKIDQRTRVPGRGRMPQNKHIIHFGREDEPKQLSVYPPAGLIQYRDSEACASPDGRAHAVPDEAEALRLARAFLKALEIDEREMVKDTNGELRVVRAKVTQGRQEFQDTISRTVSFTREVDGIPFTGSNFGGVGITFGNAGKIARLEVVWPSLKMKEKRSTASPTELIPYVKNGRSALRWGPGSDELRERIPKLQRITVNQVKLYYLGSSMDDMRTSILPFATLEITAYFPNTNYVLSLNAPTAASDTK